MPFGSANVVTNLGKAILADRVRTSPGTYTVSPKFCGMGVGATGAGRTAAAADTALTTEVESRATGTESAVTVTNTGDAYQVVGTIAASAGRSVDEAGLFDASTVGHMFTSATFTVIPLNNGDSVQFTWKVQLT